MKVFLYTLALSMVLVVSLAGLLKSSGSASIKVELDVFSGRENPTWTLSEQQGRKLRSMIRGLSSTTSRSAQGDGLGYRGFSVHFRSTAAESVLNVYRKVVKWKEHDKAMYYIDPERSLERWLLSTGKRSVEPELYKHLLKEVGENGT